MTKIYTLLLLFTGAIVFSQTQDIGKIGINTSNPKSTLDIQAGSEVAKGVLFPRLTGDEVQAMTSSIAEEQMGLVVYVTEPVSTADNATETVKVPGYYWFYYKDDGNSVEKKWKRLEPTGLEQIQENSKLGWRLIGANPSQYAETGKYAVDVVRLPSQEEINNEEGVEIMGNGPMSSVITYKELKNNTGLSNFGAQGDHSFTSGLYNSATNLLSSALGYGNESSGFASFVAGSLSKAKGKASIALGEGLIAEDDNEVVVGNYNTVRNSNATISRAFTVGNGVAQRRTIRSDAFTVLSNGKTGINISNFEMTNNDAKLQVNGKVLMGNLPPEITSPISTIQLRASLDVRGDVAIESVEQVNGDNYDLIVRENSDANKGVLRKINGNYVSYAQGISSPISANTPVDSETTIGNLSVKYNGENTQETPIAIKLNNDISSYVTVKGEVFKQGDVSEVKYESFALESNTYKDLELKVNIGNRDIVNYTVNILNTGEIYKISILGNPELEPDGYVSGLQSKVIIFIEKL